MNTSESSQMHLETLEGILISTIMVWGKRPFEGLYAEWLFKGIYPHVFTLNQMIAEGFDKYSQRQ